MAYVIIRPPGRAPYALTLDRLTDHIRAARELRAMGRLADKFKRANDAIASFETTAERKIEAVVSRVGELHTKLDDVAHRKIAQLDEHMTDLHEFAADLDEEPRGNGAPRDGSDDGEKPAPAGTEPGNLAAGAWGGNAYLGTNPKT